VRHYPDDNPYARVFPFSLTPLAVSYLAGSGLCGKLPGALVQADAPALPPNCSCAFNAPLESTCAALGDMYTAMGGPGWLMQAGWAAAAAGGPMDYCTVFAGVRAASYRIQCLLTLLKGHMLQRRRADSHFLRVGS